MFSNLAMRHARPKERLVSASTLVLTLALGAPAHAAEAEAGGEVEEIVVTGQREAQRAAGYDIPQVFDTGRRATTTPSPTPGSRLRRPPA